MAYEEFKDPTRAGVAKSRGVKTVVVVDRDDTKAETETETTSAASRWGEDRRDTRSTSRGQRRRRGDEDGGEPSRCRGNDFRRGNDASRELTRRTAASPIARRRTRYPRWRARFETRSTDPTNASAEALGVTSARARRGNRRTARRTRPRDARGDAARGDDGGGERGGERA